MAFKLRCTDFVTQDCLQSAVAGVMSTLEHPWEIVTDTTGVSLRYNLAFINTPAPSITDDLVFPAQSTEGAGAKILFDTSKGAFRAGEVSGTQWDDASRGDYSTAFGENNTAVGNHSVISGGQTNEIGTGAASTATTFSTIGGGVDNKIGTLGTGGGSSHTIGGGDSNEIEVGPGSNNNTIAGGSTNLIGNANSLFSHSTIGGGIQNVIGGPLSTGNGNNNTIAGGSSNIIGNGTSTQHSVIGGGRSNEIRVGFDHTIGGGESNLIEFGNNSTISGGETNRIVLGTNQTISGGETNEILAGNHNFIGGGQINVIEVDNHSVITGGNNNRIQGGNTHFIGGGSGHRILVTNVGTHHTIAGGFTNSITSNLNQNTIGGGGTNTILQLGQACVIAGGSGNSANDDFQTISGGRNNTISAGQENTICGGGGTGGANTISAGTGNTITGGAGGVSTGNLISASGSNNTIVGGSSNTISDGAVGATSHSFAAGFDCTITHPNSAVFGLDGAGGTATTSSNSQFIMAFSPAALPLKGLHWVNGPSSAIAGTPIHIGGSQLYAFTSSKRFKKNINELEERSEEAITKLRPVTFEPKDGGKQCMGFIAEEVHQILPEAVPLDKEGIPYSVAMDPIVAVLVKEVQNLRQRLALVEANA